MSSHSSAPVTLEEALAEFYEDQEYKGNRPATLRYYRSNLQHFMGGPDFLPTHTVPEHDAVQLRLLSRDAGTSTWSEHRTECLLLVRDDSSLTQVVTAPDPGAYP